MGAAFVPRSRSDVRAGSADALIAAFSVFLHDVRGSLGAATGSLRMAHTTDASAPMIANAAQALRALSRLTQQASTWLDAIDENAPGREWVSASTLAAAVAHALGMSAPPPVVDPALGASVSSLDGVAAAIATIVQHAAGPEPAAGAVTIEVHEHALVVLFGTSDERARLTGDPRDDTTAATTGGFALLAAAETMAAHGGEVWRLARPSRAVGVAVPLERA